MEKAENLKALYHTLGCKLNFAETSTIGKILRGRGIQTAGRDEVPDIIVVNTCSVTEMADKKGRQLLRRFATQYPDATIVATGCYAQLKPQEVAAVEGVDIVLGSDEKLRIEEFVDKWLQEHRQIVAVADIGKVREFHGSCQRGDRTRYFLKVQDGCDYFCTFCTIPFARGRSRSGTIAELTEMARRAAAEGGKEIVISGVNIGDFGKNTGERFIDLLKSLDSVEGIERYRISSIEPNLLTEEIIRWCAEEARAFMPHFHIPLQAGSDKVLKLMNRRYDTALFRSRIEMIKKLIPDAFIGVDIMAGARGETPEEWEAGLSFISEMPVTRLHVFPYSERPGTKALLIDHVVSQEEKHRRVAELMKVSDAKYHEFLKSHIGRRAKVLWEQPAGTEFMHGFTENYIKVTAPYDESLVNRVTDVELGDFSRFDEESLSATVI